LLLDLTPLALQLLSEDLGRLGFKIKSLYFFFQLPNLLVLLVDFLGRLRSLVL